MMILVFFFAACGTQTYDLAEDCDVRAAELSPAEAAPSERVSATTSPVTTIWDTAVYVNDSRAEIIDIERTNCEACDQCMVDEGCLACDDCDACDVICRSECVELINFIVPEIAPGTARVSIYNGHGRSNSLALLVTARNDTGSPDMADSGDADSGIEVDTKGHDATIKPPPSALNIGTIRKEP